MAKKKIKKAVKKKIISKKKNANSSVNRKDFEAFKFGIERLNELKKDLDSLDTKGFAKEEQVIRKKLKTVSEIPNIEKAIKILKLKINKKYHPKKRKSQVKEDIQDIKEDIPAIKKQIRKLGDIKSMREDIPEIKKEIKKLGEMKDATDDIPGIKREVRKLSGIRDIQEDIREDIPDIKREIKKIGKKVEEVEKRKKGFVDSGVGVLVDTDFNIFLSHLKTTLSDRIRSREKEMDDILKTDLQEREQKFRDKYVDLIREFNNRKKKAEEEFNKKYATKVKTSLQKEIAERFNDELQKKLNAEKVELGKRYIADLKQHAQQELEKQKQRLRERFDGELEKKKSVLERGEEAKESAFDEEKKAKESSIEREKLNIRKAKQEFEIQKEEERKRMKDKLMGEFNRQLHDEISKKEKMLRERLNSEFDLKLKKQIQDHEEELKKKKLDLEFEIQRKMKQVLSR